MIQRKNKNLCPPLCTLSLLYRQPEKGSLGNIQLWVVSFVTCKRIHTKFPLVIAPAIKVSPASDTAIWRSTSKHPSVTYMAQCARNEPQRQCG